MLTGGLEETICKRTNTNLSTLYLCLSCTRPPDSTRNKYMEDIAYVQEHSQSQSQNTCNQLMIVSPLHLTFTTQLCKECNIKEVILSSTLNHFVRNTSTGVIDISSSPNYSDYVRERVYCRDLSVSSRSSFDFFVTSLIRVDIHQHDYFIFLGLKLKVIHRGRHTLFSQWYCGYVVYLLLV